MHEKKKQHKPGNPFTNRLMCMLSIHLTTLKNSFNQIIKKPFSTLITTCVIAITLSLPAILLLVIYNVQAITKHWTTSPSVSVYLNKEVEEKQVKELIKQLETLPSVKKVNYISPAEGLHDLEKVSEFAKIIPLLDSNPLPGTIKITLNNFAQGTAAITTYLQNAPLSLFVDQTKLDASWLQRVNLIFTFLKRIALSLTLFLGAGVVLVVSNTTRLMTQSNHHDMQILKFVGATNSYIRRPYLHHALLYGFFGGLLAYVLSTFLSAWVFPPLLTLLKSYQAPLQIQLGSFYTAAGLILAAIGLSMTGAWIATKQQLSQLTP